MTVPKKSPWKPSNDDDVIRRLLGYEAENWGKYLGTDLWGPPNDSRTRAVAYLSTVQKLGDVSPHGVVSAASLWALRVGLSVDCYNDASTSNPPVEVWTAWLAGFQNDLSHTLNRYEAELGRAGPIFQKNTTGLENLASSIEAALCSCEISLHLLFVLRGAWAVHERQRGTRRKGGRPPQAKRFVSACWARRVTETRDMALIASLERLNPQAFHPGRHEAEAVELWRWVDTAEHALAAAARRLMEDPSKRTLELARADHIDERLKT